MLYMTGYGNGDTHGDTHGGGGRGGWRNVSVPSNSYGDGITGYDGDGSSSEEFEDLFIISAVYDLRARVIQTLIKL